MMLATSLPLLPPASSSLFPQLNPTPSDDFTSTNSQHPHHVHHAHSSRRPKAAVNTRSTLALLAADERAIAQRKMAIAMYGYSWLKPAGCSKTMLGRREEEVEREEVERQLREVEMQERLAAEAEDQDRIAQLNERGEVVEDGERDLDDNVPEADIDDGLEDGDEEEMDGEEYGGVDLDDEVPEAEDDLSDPDLDEDGLGDDGSEGIQEGWVYDSRREPDTDEEEGVIAPLQPGQFAPRPPGTSTNYYDVDEREAEALADAMLNEDEMGDMNYGSQHHEEDIMIGGDRDLDDEVPDAEEGWEHTDTELDESEMDISILPSTTQQLQTGRRSSGLPQSIEPERRRGGNTAGRVSSGNVDQELLRSYITMQARREEMQRQQMRLQTPGTAESLGLSSDLGFSSSNANNRQSSQHHLQQASQHQPQDAQNERRGWLNAASARRNLFGIGRGNVRTTTGVSGRLFTPSPAQTPDIAATETPNVFETPDEPEQPRRRSGRLLGGIGRRRERWPPRSRDSLD